MRDICYGVDQWYVWLNLHERYLLWCQAMGMCGLSSMKDICHGVDQWYVWLNLNERFLSWCQAMVCVACPLWEIFVMVSTNGMRGLSSMRDICHGVRQWYVWLVLHERYLSWCQAMVCVAYPPWKICHGVDQWYVWLNLNERFLSWCQAMVCVACPLWEIFVIVSTNGMCGLSSMRDICHGVDQWYVWLVLHEKYLSWCQAMVCVAYPPWKISVMVSTNGMCRLTSMKDICHGVDQWYVWLILHERYLSWCQAMVCVACPPWKISVMVSTNGMCGLTSSMRDICHGVRQWYVWLIPMRDICHGVRQCVAFPPWEIWCQAMVCVAYPPWEISVMVSTNGMCGLTSMKDICHGVDQWYVWLILHERYLSWCQAMVCVAYPPWEISVMVSTNGMCGLSSMRDICHGVDQWYVWLILHERYLSWCRPMVCVAYPPWEISVMVSGNGMCGLTSMRDICHGVDQWYVWLILHERYLSWCQAMVCVAYPPWEISVMVSGNGMCGLSSMKDICHGVDQWYVWLNLHERYLSWCQAMVCVAYPPWEISVMVSTNGMCGLSSMRDICHGVRQWYVWLILHERYLSWCQAMVCVAYPPWKISVMVSTNGMCGLTSMKDICHGVDQWYVWLILHERYLSWCQAMVCVAYPPWEISVMVSTNGMCGLSSMKDICHGVDQWYVWLILHERYLSWCQAMVCVAYPPWKISVMVSTNGMCGLTSMRDICHGVDQWYVWLILHERYLSWCQAMVCVAYPPWEISVMVSGNGMCGLSSMKDICHGVDQWYVWLNLHERYLSWCRPMVCVAYPPWEISVMVSGNGMCGLTSWISMVSSMRDICHGVRQWYVWLILHERYLSWCRPMVCVA